MLDVRAVVARVHGLSEQRLRLWTEQGLVRPSGAGEQPVFAEVDIARLRLLVTLEDELAVEPETVPMVIGLLDQIHGLRRALRTLGEAVGRQPDHVRAEIQAAVAVLTLDVTPDGAADGVEGNEGTER